MSKIGDILYKDCTGRIKNWNEERGFGGVMPHQDHITKLREVVPSFRWTVFVHCRDFARAGEGQTARVGMEVKFDVMQAAKGPAATNVVSYFAGEPSQLPDIKENHRE